MPCQRRPHGGGRHPDRHGADAHDPAGGSALVVGYGRIGMALAPRLRALGMEVTVCARRCEPCAGGNAWLPSRAAGGTGSGGSAVQSGV
ncbi:MAG: NAD(P)-dependent oxidoreductase [Ruminococcus sp.]